MLTLVLSTLVDTAERVDIVDQNGCLEHDPLSHW